MLTDAARKLARRRTWAALAIFAVAALVAPFAPLPSFGMICCALVLYLRPESISRRRA